MIIKWRNFISNPRYVWTLVAIIAIGASMQAIFSGNRALSPGGVEYTRYNNYQIFEQSFFHLIEQKDLYILYPTEHWDLFKYSPTFSAFFGVFALFPDIIGLTLWNLLNAFVLVGAIYYLPKFNNYQKGIMSAIVVLELLTSIQSEQSNGLMAGLLVLAFGLLEKKHYFWATFCLVFTVFIKLFGIVGFALLLFHFPKWKLAFYSFINALILFAIPFLFIDLNQYLSIMESYGLILTNDSSRSYGFSLMGIIHTWYNVDFNKLIVVVCGAILFLIPYTRFKLFDNYLFKLLALASVLLWVIVFNHMSESPTFVIAMTGVAVWFVSNAKSKLNISLLIFAFILTSISPTDLFPKLIRDNYVVPFALKVLPCILIWFKIIYEMLFLKPNQDVNVQEFATRQDS